MTKFHFLAATFLALPLSAIQASNTVITNFTTVLANKSQAHPVMLSDGFTLVPNNTGFVAAGFFSVSDAAVASLWCNGNRLAVAASFVQFGSSGVVGGSPALNNAGLFRLTASAPNAPGSPFEGKNIYTVVGNGVTFQTSTQILIFKSTSTFATDPTLEARSEFLGMPLPGTLLVGFEGTPGALYVGGLLANVTTTPFFLTDPLGECAPEPTTAVLCVLSLGCGLISRRRENPDVCAAPRPPAAI